MWWIAQFIHLDIKLDQILLNEGEPKLLLINFGSSTIKFKAHAHSLWDQNLAK